MNCCAHHDLPAGCNQGRDCPSRAHSALYMADGGHTFHRGIAFPIDADTRELQDDQPLATPDTVGLVLLALIVSGAVGLVVGIAAAIAMWLPHLRFPL